MTPEEERQRTWREAVRAFRLAVTVLEDPVPALFADLAAPEGLRDLERELPLVYFSPFGALPNTIAYGRDEPSHKPTGKPGGITDRRPGLGSARPRVSRLPDGPEDALRAVSPGAGESVVEPPSFSFRRSDTSGVPAGQRQPSMRDGDVQVDAASTPRGDFLIPGPRREGPSSAEERPGREAREYSGATPDGRDAEMGQGVGDLAPEERRPIPPTTLLNDLAEDTLRAAQSRAQKGSVRPSGASKPQPAGSQEPALEAYDNGAIALIGSLAERLLAPEARVVRSSPTTEPGDGGVARSVAASMREESGPDRLPLDFLDGVDEESAGWPPSGWDQLDPSTEVAPDRYTEAETFAALVNDALARQARRHGVDLS